MTCEVYQPRYKADSCDECGRPKDAHPFVTGRPERPFDPLPKIPNAGYV